jgi:hypothetical protein
MEGARVSFYEKTLRGVADQEFLPAIFFEYLYLYIPLYALENVLDKFFPIASLPLCISSQ